MSKILVLQITAGFEGMEQTIHPVLLQDEDVLVLVDCGFVGSLPLLEAAIRDKGLSPEQLTHIVLTHHDHDHMGAAAAFKAAWPEVKVLASKEEEPIIAGIAKSLRLTQAEQLQALLPSEQKAFGQAFMSLLNRVEPVAVDETLAANQSFDWCGGCRIMATPGHTPGHISLWLPEHKTVIAGDAMALEEGRPAIANPQFTLDMAEAQASMDKLLALPAQAIICYHGGVYRPLDHRDTGSRRDS